MHAPAELQDDSAYSQISPLAVVALVLGLASPVAFIGNFFFLIPIAALGVALAAIGRINRSGGALTGRLLARIAIALALLCTVSSLVRDSVRDSLLKRQAVKTAEQWMQMLADGQINDAIALLSGDGHSMLVPAPSMGQPPMSEEVSASLGQDRMRSDALTRLLNGSASPPKLVSATEPLFDDAKTIVAATFSLRGDAGAPREVRLQLLRTPYYESHGKPWRVDRWAIADAAETPAR